MDNNYEEKIDRYCKEVFPKTGASPVYCLSLSYVEAVLIGVINSYNKESGIRPLEYAFSLWYDDFLANPSPYGLSYAFYAHTSNLKEDVNILSNRKVEIKITGKYYDYNDGIFSPSNEELLNFDSTQYWIIDKTHESFLDLCQNTYIVLKPQIASENSVTTFSQTTFTKESGDVLGEMENVVNPKTGVIDILIFVIPAIVLIVVALIPIFKEEIFKKI